MNPNDAGFPLFLDTLNLPAFSPEELGDAEYHSPREDGTGKLVSLSCGVGGDWKNPIFHIHWPSGNESVLFYDANDLTVCLNPKYFAELD